MNIVILGAGRVGWQLARQLINEGKEVTLIEKQLELARRAADRLDCKVVTGEGNNLEVLKKAGVEDADFFVSVTESDEINMIACSLVSAEYGDKVKTLARVRNVAYSTSQMVQQKINGFGQIVNPEIEAAREVIRSLEQGAVGTVIPFADSGLAMTSLTVGEESRLIGKQLKDLRTDVEYDFLLPLVVRDRNAMVPDGAFQIKANDVLYVMAQKEATEVLIAEAGGVSPRLKRIAIAGGGQIGRYVADYFLGKEENGVPDAPEGFIAKLIKRLGKKSTGRSIHFIERDYSAARELAEDYPNALVTNADISDEEITESGILEGYDLLVSATGNQELNLITALHAKNHGVKRTIALVKKSTYVNVAYEIGIDVPISVTDTMVNTILRFIRKGNIQSIYSIAGNDFEIIDLLLDKNSPLVNKAVKDLKLPRNSLILLVIRQDDYLIPYGDFILHSRDRIMIITPRENVKKLEETVVGT